MLNEFVYCPRLFFYEWVEGVFAESGDTVEGSLRHETIRGRAEALPSAGEADGEKIHARSVTLSSDRLKLIAIIDLVEGTGSAVTPVDYKRGAPRMGAEGPEA
jgi:CRISPR-associated protein Cas1